MNNRFQILLVLVLILISSEGLKSQLSPGELSKYHMHLEGLSNCTKCHDIGKKVSNQKCLNCHDEIAKRIDAKKGYHSSDEVQKEDCFHCHSDHHGRDFEIVRFITEEFDHSKSGYKLEGAHREKECADCHKNEFIKDEEILKKQFTYLGLTTECLSCHDDYHDKTLSSSCTNCHDSNAFKPAPGFSHDKTKFKLKGKHQNVECEKCHEITFESNKKFQKFSGIKHNSCTNCHKDIHNNKFGQDCTKCHDESSFKKVGNIEGFDHTQTGFDLLGKHQSLSCKSCHKANYTEPIAHNKCYDCHDDYHNGEFKVNEIITNCNKCHTENEFSGSSFSIEDHQQSIFQLEGAHLATPCFSCHLKETKWTFRNIGKICFDCHTDIHDTYIDTKYYPDNNCKACHKTETWSSISFDHNKTGYKLEGKHKNKSCRDCHFQESEEYKIQRFSSLNSECIQCHIDKHNKQFDNNGKTDCLDCHNYTDWHPTNFNHDNTNFPLDGKHKDVACKECHKPKENNKVVFIEYKIKNYKCEDCH